MVILIVLLLGAAVLYWYWNFKNGNTPDCFGLDKQSGKRNNLKNLI